ncbi:WxL domain-containing protein [Enterococcus mundtii]|nr:WxL domain-containing protein [Enterococcus mundtii]
MTTSRYHKLVVLCTSIFCVQTVALPTSVLFSTSVEAVDVQEVTTDSSILANDYLDGLREVTEVPLRFSPSNLRVTGEVTEPVSVSFYANKPTQEAKIRLPKEAVVDKDRLPAGLTITETAEENHWLLHSEAPRETFTLPLIFQETGTYEASIEEAKTTIAIDSPTTSLEQKEEEQKSVEQEVDKTTDDVTDDATEESQHELSEPENNDPIVAETDEHADDEAESSIEKKEATANEFSGQIAEVSTMVEFREAIADPDVSTISVQANLTESTANIMTIDRPIKIQGNGHTLTFGNNGFYFQLAEVSEPTTFRIEDATVTKTGATPLVNATTEVSRNWTLEIEDVAEVNANTMRLASIPEGTVQFTGGTSNFTRTSSAQTFIEAKEVKAINQAKVTISRGNATIFLAAATVSEPKLTIENGANVAITTTSGVANTIDFRGENAEITLQSGGDLTINTVGTTAAPTNIRNNTIAMTGAGPKVTVRDKSNLTTTSTAAKRGLHLSGNNSQVVVNDSKLSVTSATQSAMNLSGTNPQVIVDSSELSVTSTTQSAVNLSGEEPTFSVTNSHTDIRSETGATLALTGVSPKVNYVGSTGSLTSTTGQRLNLIGDNPQLSLDQTQLSMGATSGRGIYLQGTTPQVLLKQSTIEITDSQPSQGMILQGADALLDLTEHSELTINGAGTGTLENIQIGANNPRPELSLTGASKVTVATTSGTGGASDTANNGLHLRGEQPKMTLSEESELNVSVISNARRGVYLNGAEADLTIKDSQLNINTQSGQGININGSDARFHAINSKTSIETVAGQRMNLIGASPVLNLDNSHLTMKTMTGRGVYLQGATPQVLLNESAIEMTDTGASQGMILEGTDALLSLKKNSIFKLNGGGTGTLENIQIGNQQLRPKVIIEDHSSLEVNTTSGNGTASATANNILNLSGGEPELQVLDESTLALQVASGNRRGILLNGAEATTSINNSQVSLELNGNGMGYHSIGLNNALNIENSEWSGNNSKDGHNIYLQGNNGTVNINSGANVQLEATTAGSIWISGDAPKLNISDEGTVLYAKSSTTAAYTRATIYLGNYSGGASPGAEMNIAKKASVEVESNDATTIGIWSQNAKFNLMEDANLLVKQGASSADAGGSAAALRFMNWGNSTFTVDQSKMRIEKAGGSTPALRMFAANNAINVINGGEFTVYNPGNGTPNDGGSASNNQGISYSGGINNSFSVEGIGSSVNIIADNGPALDMGNSSPNLEVKDGGIFRAEGRTNSATGGIFRAAIINVNFDNPLYMNFQNNRSGGGNIFDVSNGSSLKATNSDLSVWKNGKDFDDEPDLDFRSIDYSFSGLNFNTLGETSAPDQLNTEVFGTTGLAAYSRLSSNNARWAIADELRIPTNADKKIYGHVSIPVGVEGTRSAWNDEAIATVEIVKPNGDKQEYTAKTVGHSQESTGLSIYGEEPRGGLFEVQLDEPLEAGTKVRISKVELSSGELTTGFDHQILTETVEVFPIVPPKPATFASSVITRNSQKVEGVSENPDVSVTATHNGQKIDTENVEVDENGKFSIDLSTIQLAEDDEIQVFLRDKNGFAKAAGIVNPPLTNDEQGNINPAQPLDFHDVTFAEATVLTVGNFDPVAPVDPIDPENEVLPENQPELPEEQGALSIDFISRFNFGKQNISVKDKTYYAQPQRLLNEDGTVNEIQERPNFIQISDRRPDNERSGWQLSVTQNGQFSNQNGHELIGSEIQLLNQELVTAQGGTAPALKEETGQKIIPNTKRILLQADEKSGTGTWIYRFGNAETADKSVGLYVPKGTNPEAKEYSTTLTWELSSVPENQ